MSTMNLRSATASIILLLTACPGRTPGDTSSGSSTADDGDTSGTLGESSGSVMVTTGAPDLTTGFDCLTIEQVGADADAVAEKCAKHPFNQAPDCDGTSAPQCEDLLLMLAGTRSCSGLSICDYYQCADDIGVAPCGVLPESCKALFACVQSAAPTEDCCELHGTGSAPGICGISTQDACVGCDGLPVLCMTTGCTTPGEKDCCLSPEGKTVAC